MEKVLEEIEVKKLFKKQKIKIFSNKILVSKKSITDFLEFEISLDEIETKKTIKSESNNNLMALGFLLSIIGLIINTVGGTLIFAWILLLSLCLIVLGVFFRKKTITILTYSSAPIVIEFNRTNEIEARNFADKLINYAKEYLIKKYSKIDKDLPFENQLNNLDFLRTKDLISDIEFEKLKNQLLGKKEGSQAVGFEKNE